MKHHRKLRLHTLESRLLEAAWNWGALLVLILLGLISIFGGKR